MARNTIKRVFSFAILGGTSLLLACSDGGSDFPEVAGWTQVGEVLTYDTDTLWEYINGAAELFVEYGVQTCRTTDLSSGDVTVTVDLYDMATPLDAFGVYERESSGQVIPMENAVAAVVSPPYQALMVRGATYVKVNVFEGELTEAMGLELLRSMAGALAGETELPPELGLLPQAGKVAGSDGFKPESFMGKTELNDCLYAQYGGTEGEAWQGFVVLPSAADQVWEGLNQSWESLDLNGIQVLYAEIPYRGLVGVIKTGDGVFGVSGAADPDALLERLGGFIS